MKSAPRTVANNPKARALVVLAYAHAIMEDLITDYALAGKQPVPKSVKESARVVGGIDDLGMRFEETFLQHNAPHWSIGEGSGTVAEAVRREALDWVDRWLLELADPNRKSEADNISNALYRKTLFIEGPDVLPVAGIRYQGDTVILFAEQPED